jgi:hypothetical protein
MAVATGMRPTVKTRNQTQVETEPKVVTDQRLGKIVQEHAKSQQQTDSIFLREIEYVKENDIKRDVLIATLIQYGKLKDSSAKAEASVIQRCCKRENEELLQQAIDGEITIRELRQKSVFGERKERKTVEPDPEKQTTTKIRKLAEWTIKNDVFDDPADFGRRCREVFTEVWEKQQDAAEEGNGEPEEEESDVEA